VFLDMVSGGASLGWGRGNGVVGWVRGSRCSGGLGLAKTRNFLARLCTSSGSSGRWGTHAPNPNFLHEI
jgi:hypothetical protein